MSLSSVYVREISVSLRRTLQAAEASKNSDDSTAADPMLSLVQWCREVVHSSELFDELDIPMAFAEIDLLVSSAMQKTLANILTDMAAIINMIGLNSIMYGDTDALVPSAVSILLLLNYHVCEAVQQLILESLEHAWALTDSVSHRDTTVFHWMLACKILMTSRHRVDVVRLKRICERFALTSIPQLAPYNGSIVECIRKHLKRPSLQSDTSAIVPLTPEMLRSALIRLIAFSMCGRSRQAALIEGCGFFFSEIGRLGSQLSSMAAADSEELAGMACAILGLLSDDQGRMFDADPSIGELYCVLTDRLCGAMEDKSPSRRCWATHGFSQWNTLSVLYNGGVNTGHSMNGAIAARLIGLQKYLRCPKGVLLVEALTVCNAFHESKVLESNISINVRDMLLDSLSELSILTASSSPVTCGTDPIQLRRLIGRILACISMLVAVIRDGGAHVMASSLLLLTQSHTEAPAVEPNTTTINASTTTATASVATPQQGRKKSLVEWLVNLLCEEKLHDRIRYHLVECAISVLEVAWHQSPRDLAPYIMENHLLVHLHCAVHRIVTVHTKSSTIHTLTSLPPSVSVDTGKEVEEALTTAEVLTQCRSLCNLTGELMEGHEAVRNHVLHSAQQLEVMSRSPAFSRPTASSVVEDDMIDFNAPIHAIIYTILCTDALALEQENVEHETLTSFTKMVKMSKPLLTALLIRLMDSLHQSERTHVGGCSRLALSFRNGMKEVFKSVPEMSMLFNAADIDGKIHALLLNHLLSEEHTYADTKALMTTKAPCLRNEDFPLVAYSTAVYNACLNHKISEHALMKAVHMMEDMMAKPQLSSVIAKLLATTLLAVLSNVTPDVASRLAQSSLVLKLSKQLLSMSGDTEEVVIATATLDVWNNICAIPMERRVSRAVAMGQYVLLHWGTKLVQQWRVDTWKTAFDVVMDGLRHAKTSASKDDEMLIVDNVSMIMRCALLTWHEGLMTTSQTSSSRAAGAGDALGEWLNNADVVTFLAQELKSIYGNEWFCVPLDAAIEVYYLHRLLIDGVAALKGLSNNALWSEVICRVQRFLAESVTMFLYSVPRAPASYVKAQPLVESLVLNLTSIMTDSEVVAFWGHLIDQNCFRGVRDTRPGFAEVGWLYRLVNHVITFDATTTTSNSSSNADDEDSSANLIFMGFLMMDDLIVHLQTICDDACAAVKTQDSHILVVADAFLSMAYVTLQKSSMHPSHLLERNRAVFATEELMSNIFAPLMSLLGRAELTTNEFYARAVKATLLLVSRVADAHARFRIGQWNVAEGGGVPNTREMRDWSQVFKRLSVLSNKVIEQIGYLDDEQFIAVGEFISQSSVSDFLDRTPSTYDGEGEDNNQDKLSPENPITRIPSPVVQGSVNTNSLRMAMLDLNDEACTEAFIHAVATEVCTGLYWESQEMVQPSNAAIAFRPDESLCKALHLDMDHNDFNHMTPLLVDYETFVGEMLDEVGPERLDSVMSFLRLRCRWVCFEDDKVTTNEPGCSVKPASNKDKASGKKGGKAAKGNPSSAKNKKQDKNRTNAKDEDGNEVDSETTTSSSSTRKKWYLLINPRKSNDVVARKTILLKRLALPLCSSGSLSSVIAMTAFVFPPPCSTTMMSPSPFPFLDACTADAMSEKRLFLLQMLRDVGKHFSVVLVSQLLAHITSILQNDDASDTVLQRVIELLSTCFNFVPHFDQRKLSFALKHDAELQKNFHFCFTTITTALVPLRDGTESGTTTLGRWDVLSHTHKDENAFASLLFLEIVQRLSLTDLASLKRKHALVTGVLQLDRYGVTDDRASFADGSDVSDDTLRSDSSDDEHAGNDDDGNNDLPSDADQENDSVERLFAASFGASSGGGSNDYGEDEDNEDEDELNEDNSESGSDEIEADEYDRMQESAHRMSLMQSSLLQLVRLPHSTKADDDDETSDIAVVVERVPLKLLPDLNVQTAVRALVPIGDTGRWLRYYRTNTAPPGTCSPLTLQSRRYVFDELPCEAATNPTPTNEENEAQTISRLIAGVAPMLTLRGRNAQRLLFGYLDRLCMACDERVVAVIRALIAHSKTAPITRLFVLRLSYTLLDHRKTLAQATAFHSVEGATPWDLEKVRFMEELIHFLVAPTMSVLCQRLTTYVMTAVYSMQNNADDDTGEGGEHIDDAENEEEDEEEEEEVGHADPEASADQPTTRIESDGDAVDDEFSEPDDGAEPRQRRNRRRGQKRAAGSFEHQRKLHEEFLKWIATSRQRTPLASENINVKVPHHHAHPLVWTNVDEVEDYGHSFYCDGCNIGRRGFSYHCQKCHYDLCVFCYHTSSRHPVISNDDFESGGPYWQPSIEVEEEERHNCSSLDAGHDQFIRLAVQTTQVTHILFEMLRSPNCVDGCTEFLVDMITTFFRTSTYPWDHPMHKKYPIPILPEVPRLAILETLLVHLQRNAVPFFNLRQTLIAETAQRLSIMNVKATQTPGAAVSVDAMQHVHRCLTREEAADLIFSMDCIHSESQCGSQVFRLLPLCVEASPDQQSFLLVDGVLQMAWDTLVAHFELLTNILSHLTDGTPQSLYGLVTMSQGNFELLAVVGKYYRAINWRNSYVAAVQAKPASARLHDHVASLVSLAQPLGMPSSSTTLMRSSSELFGLDESTPLSARQQSTTSAGGAGGAAAQLPSFSSSVAVSQGIRKSEILLDVIRKTKEVARPEAASRPGTAGAREAKVEVEDPWNEQRTEEIGSIVSFAQSYRMGLNFLIASRNDPQTTLDEGLDFLLNTSKILDFAIRLSAFRAKMNFFHNNSESEFDLTVQRFKLLQSTVDEVASFHAATVLNEESAMLTAIEVTFFNEEALDAGGVKREWLTLVFQNMIQLLDQGARAAEASASPDSSPSKRTPSDESTSDDSDRQPESKQNVSASVPPSFDEYFPPIFARAGDQSGGCFELSPNAEEHADKESLARIVGMLVGLGVAYDIPIDLHLTRATYSHMIGRQPNFKDLEATDPSLYKNLKFVMDITTEEEMEALCLAFTAPTANGAEVPLIENGGDIPVTLANRNEYVRRRAEYRMTTQSKKLLVPFIEGFHFMMPIGFLQCFTAEDLELVCCGVSTVDVEDLRAHSTYEGFTPSSPHVRWFWECCTTMPQQDLVRLVQFATASTRPPAGGFGSLHPPFQLVRCPASANLPVAHTCMNRIDLPEYENITVMREKLKQAITLGNVGFALV